MPQCGFSRAVIQVLDLHGVPPDKMQTYDVLEDSELRSGIKDFSCVCSLGQNNYAAIS
jgi:monothiol glutaredoxin